MIRFCRKHQFLVLISLLLYLLFNKVLWKHLDHIFNQLSSLLNTIRFFFYLPFKKKIYCFLISYLIWRKEYSPNLINYALLKYKLCHLQLRSFEISNFNAYALLKYCTLSLIRYWNTLIYLKLYLLSVIWTVIWSFIFYLNIYLKFHPLY